MSTNLVNKDTGELVTLANGTRMWIGTKSAHDLAVQQGKMPNNCMVCITDDAAGEEAWEYSTSETNTGKKWIDGKPIYRRVFTANSVPSDNYIGTITNLDTPIKLEVIARNNSDNAWLPRSYAVYQSSGNPQSRIEANGKVYFHIDNYTPNKIIAILEYTKTTD